MATARPLKPHKTFAQQLQLLGERGLVIEDADMALHTLERLGYYRLAGYFYPLRQTNPRGTAGRQDAFAHGASFKLLADLYEFDKQLRMLVLDAAERLEVALRVCIAYELGRLNPAAHTEPALFDRRFTESRAGKRSGFDRWHDKLGERLSAAHDDFVKHHRDNYGGVMPIWVCIELWDFGMLSRFYAGMKFKHREKLAERLGGLEPTHVESWLKTLNFIRNVAAHHSRLWNRNVPEVPRLPSPNTHPDLEHLTSAPGGAYRLYVALACAQFLLKQTCPGADWSAKLKAAVATLPSSPLLPLSAAGFPDDWVSQALWN